MVLQADQDRMRQLLVEALPMLCRSGLNFSSEFCVEALIGITLDKNDVMLVSIKETVKNPGAEDENGSEKTLDISISHADKSSIPRKKPHRKRRHSRSVQQSSDSEDDDHNDEPSAMKRERNDFPNTTGSASDFDSASNSMNFPSADQGDMNFQPNEQDDRKPAFEDHTSADAIIVKQEPAHSTDFSDVSFGNIESGQGYDVSPMNQTFPGASTSAASDQHNTSIDPHNSTWLWRSVDGTREYSLLEEATSRNASFVMDDKGYFYTMKRTRNQRKCIQWQCKRRSKNNHCHASLVQRAEGFAERREHNHDPETDMLTIIRVRKAIKAKVGIYHEGNDLLNLVREVLAEVTGESSSFQTTWCNETSLVRYARRVKAKKLKEYVSDNTS